MKTVIYSRGKTLSEKLFVTKFVFHLKQDKDLIVVLNEEFNDRLILAKPYQRIIMMRNISYFITGLNCGKSLKVG